MVIIVLSGKGWFTRSVTATPGSWVNVARMPCIIDLVYWENAYARYVVNGSGDLRKVFDSTGDFDTYIKVACSSDSIYIETKGRALEVSCRILK